MVKFFVFCSIFFVLFIPSAISQTNPIYLLKEGKKALDSHNYEKAIDCFSKALPELREIGDYILLWRAKAYKAINSYKEGLEDIQTLLKTYPKSPLTREAKRVEIEFIKKSDNEEEIESIYEKFIFSYPEDLEIKLEYAQFLKNREKAEKAKIYLKEIFLTSSPLADIAEKLLDKSDITVNDLIKKAQNLNNSYYFKKAENYLLKALNNSSLRQKKEIYSLLGYSLFMQKKYTEAAEAFKKSNDIYWLARSYLRAKDYESFEKMIPKLIQSSEVEIGSLLTNYANIKRRTGDVKGALNILKTVLNKYPTLEEDIMWTTGWILYSSKKFDEAERIFKNLYQNYKKIKYLYWYIRAANKKG
ncbi:MAG: tetratricopeptide repeat protein, partial [Thermodesulfovibrionaceae bacterium]